MATRLLEQVTCDDGCGRIIEYGTPRVHIDRGRYTDPNLAAAVEFVDLDFVDFDHLANYVTQQGTAVQTLLAVEARLAGLEVAPGLSQDLAVG